VRKYPSGTSFSSGTLARSLPQPSIWGGRSACCHPCWTICNWGPLRGSGQDVFPGNCRRRQQKQHVAPGNVHSFPGRNFSRRGSSPGRLRCQWPDCAAGGRYRRVARRSGRPKATAGNSSVWRCWLRDSERKQQRPYPVGRAAPRPVLGVFRLCAVACLAVDVYVLAAFFLSRTSLWQSSQALVAGKIHRASSESGQGVLRGNGHTGRSSSAQEPRALPQHEDAADENSG